VDTRRAGIWGARWTMDVSRHGVGAATLAVVVIRSYDAEHFADQSSDRVPTLCRRRPLNLAGVTGCPFAAVWVSGRVVDDMAVPDGLGRRGPPRSSREVRAMRSG
jgi:hypothetical protein